MRYNGWEKSILSMGLQRDVVYLCWPIAPSYYESKCGGSGGVAGLSQWVQLCTSRDMEPFGDLPPYLNLWLEMKYPISWRENDNRRINCFLTAKYFVEDKPCCQIFVRFSGCQPLKKTLAIWLKKKFFRQQLIRISKENQYQNVIIPVTKCLP
jgi:hypothetical protein